MITDNLGNPADCSAAAKTFTGLNIGGGTGLDDGRAGAPAGVAAQYPNVFTNGFTDNAGVHHNIVKRPSWNVAGVDYGVGVPASSYPLKNPNTAALPAGVTRSGSGPGASFICGSNVLLDGWDFSNGDWRVRVTGNNVTVQNCKFKATVAGGDSFVQANSAVTDVTVLNCEMDAAYITFGLNGSTLLFRGNTNTTMKYCLINNTISDVWDIDGASTYNAGLVTLKYNLVVNVGRGGHPDILQIQSGHFQFDLQFNTVIQDDSSLNGTQGFVFSQGTSSFIQGANTFAYNTGMATKAGVAGLQISQFVGTDPTTMQPGATFPIHDNYINPGSGLFGSFLRGGVGSGITESNNYSMTDGSIIT